MEGGSRQKTSSYNCTIIKNEMTLSSETMIDPEAAFACAKSFQQLAEAIIVKIPTMDNIPDSKDLAAAADYEGILDFPQHIADIACSASNLAFAIELYLKSLLSFLGNNIPQTHDLYDLYNAIPQQIRINEIERLYHEQLEKNKRSIERKMNLLIAKPGFEDDSLIDASTIEMARELMHEMRGSFSLAVGAEQVPRVNNAPTSVNILDVLKRSRNLFTSWRYVFEISLKANEEHHVREFEYRSLLLIASTLRIETERLLSAIESRTESE